MAREFRTKSFKLKNFCKNDQPSSCSQACLSNFCLLCSKNHRTRRRYTFYLCKMTVYTVCILKANYTSNTFFALIFPYNKFYVVLTNCEFLGARGTIHGVSLGGLDHATRFSQWVFGGTFKGVNHKKYHNDLNVFWETYFKV